MKAAGIPSIINFR